MRNNSKNNNSKNRYENSGKRNRRNNSHKVMTATLAAWTGIAVFAIIVSVAVWEMVAHAVEGTEQMGGISERVRSNGRVQYEYAVIDGDDLKKIDTYISEKKNAAAGILVRLGTKFRRQDGKYVYDRNPDVGQEDIDLSGLSWEILTQAGKESQNIPAGMAVLNPEAALYIEGVEERTDFYADATEDNLSAGKAAWVEGRLLLGNGADNDKAYRQGLTDGEQGNIPENLCPIFRVHEAVAEIRHAHVGSQAESEGVSGCYHNYSVTTATKRRCDITLKYLEPVWYPNENEPDGGTWHGGFYTCSHHGGVFEKAGICGKDYIKYVTEWKHDVTCGLENVLYARLIIKASDAEDNPDTEWEPGTAYSVKQVSLKAVLEEDEGYDRLMWKEGDELVWTDDRGNVLGMGPELTVFEPGIYRCSINVANSDIDRRMAEVTVAVSGLMMSGN